MTELWTEGADRQAITGAADTIDAVLQKDPLSQGESRSEKHRILFISPLAVIYRVEEDDRMVFVLKVWEFPANPAMN